MRCGGGSQPVFHGAAALLFAASAGTTVAWCGAMPPVCGMARPGGQVMAMTWMRLPGQTWLDAGALFLGMWAVMMPAMMLPSLLPMLHRYRRSVPASAARLELLTTVVAAGYFCVWIALGTAVYPLGAGLAMHLPTLTRALPLGGGVVMLTAGALQFSAWKARHLACSRACTVGGGALPARVASAWRYGLRLGVHCCQCCAGPTAILLVLGVMDLRVMALVTAAITAERVTPEGWRVAQAIGAVAVTAGMMLIGQAVGVGR